MLRILNRIVEVVAIVVFMAVTFKAAMWLTQATGFPVTIKEVTALNSPVSKGVDLQVRINREKTRQCPVTSKRRIQTLDGATVAFESETWVGGSVEDPYVDVVYSTADLPIGQYILSANLYYTCPDHVYEVLQDPGSFRVVP